MNIILDSRKVLKAIYQLIDDNAHSLVVSIWMDKMAEELNMSKEHLNLCIHYLILGEYITGDFCFNNQENSSKEVIFTAKGIEKVENVTL